MGSVFLGQYSKEARQRLESWYSTEYGWDALLAFRQIHLVGHTDREYWSSLYAEWDEVGGRVTPDLRPESEPYVYTPDAYPETAEPQRIPGYEYKTGLKPYVVVPPFEHAVEPPSAPTLDLAAQAANVAREMATKVGAAVGITPGAAEAVLKPQPEIIPSIPEIIPSIPEIIPSIPEIELPDISITPTIQVPGIREAGGLIALAILSYAILKER